MNATRRAVVPLKILLALTFLALVVAQVMSFPGMFAHWAEQDAGFRPYRWPLLAVFELGMACVQVVIICIWRLLTLVKEDRVFTRASLAWVDAIIVAIGLAWLLLIGMFVFILTRADDPGDAFAALLITLPGTVFALLMVVMRALLLQATDLKSDMETVI